MFFPMEYSVISEIIADISKAIWNAFHDSYVDFLQWDKWLQVSDSYEELKLLGKHRRKSCED
jgi:hypothetical protein